MHSCFIPEVPLYECRRGNRLSLFVFVRLSSLKLGQYFEVQIRTVSSHIHLKSTIVIIPSLFTYFLKSTCFIN
jgi:hypothetical protein